MFTDRVDILDDFETFVRAVYRRVRGRFVRSIVSIGGRSGSRERGIGFGRLFERALAGGSEWNCSREAHEQSRHR